MTRKAGHPTTQKLWPKANAQLEKAYRLWGSDMSADWTPLEAGMERFVDFNKGDFIGRDALLRQKEAGVEQPLYHPKNERLLGVKPDHRGWTRINGGRRGSPRRFSIRAAGGPGSIADFGKASQGVEDGESRYTCSFSHCATRANEDFRAPSSHSLHLPGSHER
jgi:hypothetical protein